MCGIFSYLSKLKLTKKQISWLSKCADLSRHRGPDKSLYRIIKPNLFYAFHRLRINGLSVEGDQPMTINQNPYLSLICNGEIYNAFDVARKENFKMETGSDCEIIIHLYEKYGIDRTIRMLDGVFAFCLYDEASGRLFVGRDPIGVRALYYGETINGDIAFASEMKSIQPLVSECQQFLPGTYSVYDIETTDFIENVRYYNYNYKGYITDDWEELKNNIRTKFYRAVEKRLMSERPIGALLSGGFDSSIVCAVLVKVFDITNLQTFSVGLEGSPDLRYAREVAEYLGTDHHEVILTEKDMLNAIPDDIYQIETFDTTTIRASTPMYMLSKYIKENTDVTVIFSGEGSDEASGSYLYFHNAPDDVAFENETKRLMKDLCYYDVLRCDKSTAGAGLEVRVPFLDKDFLDYYLRIPGCHKRPTKERMEKYLLRETFTGPDLLPDSVLWRMKEGMSDGVSSQKRGWFQIIQDHVETKYTTTHLETALNEYSHEPPRFKEALYYRHLFNMFYPGKDNTIPYYWLPKWSGDLVEPSARALDNVYQFED